MTLDEYRQLRDSGQSPEQIRTQQGATGIKGFGVGVAKGGLNTIRGLGKFGQELLQQTAGRGIEALGGPKKETLGSKLYEGDRPDAITPKGGAEKTGYFIEQIAEFLAPSSAIVKGQRAIAGLVGGTSKLARAGRLGLKMGTEGVATGGLIGIQQGEIDDEAKIGALFGAMFPLAGVGLRAVKKGFGKGIQATGTKISKSVIRPQKADLLDVGLKRGGPKEASKVFMNNVFKHDLGGSLQDTFVKTNTKLNSLGKKLASAIKGRADENVNLLDVAVRTGNRLLEKKPGAFGTNKAMTRAVDDLVEEIVMVSQNTGVVNLVEAQMVKRGAGMKGAWSYGMLDREAKALEKVYTTFYRELKDEIVRIAPPRVAKINKEISELIPIMNAVIRRMPVAERNNAISLTDVMGLYASAFEPTALTIVGANKLSKSGKFGNMLVKAGKALKDRKSKTAVGRRFSEINADFVAGANLKKGLAKAQTKLPKFGMTIEDISKKSSGGIPQTSAFTGLEGVTLKTIEKLKGKTTVSKQFISDLTNSGDIKQAERNAIRNILNEMPEGKVNVKEFSEKVKGELLPLTSRGTRDTPGTIPGKPMFRDMYESTSLNAEIRGNVADYRVNIYESPIKTSAGGVHFGDVGVDNYYAHTRIEDMADTIRGADRKLKIIKGKSSAKPFKVVGDGVDQNFATRAEAEKGLKDFATTLKTDTDTRRVIEIQSDLFQKGGLEIEKGITKGMSDKEVAKLLKDAPKSKVTAELVKRHENITQLEPYRNIWHERIIREEVKRASQDGKKILQIPTGETAMKIEGLGERTQFVYSGTNRPIVANEIKIGEEIATNVRDGLGTNIGEQHIITDVLGDGKFKALTKRDADEMLDMVKGSVPSRKNWGLDKLEGYESALKETFDISGKIDTNNPIYRFYEKEVGKYLKNKYNAQIKKDPQGVNWWEIRVPKEASKLPVEAFGAVPFLVNGKPPNDTKRNK